MRKCSAVITAVGGYVPENVVPNAVLEQKMEIPPGWIPKYLGVRERRILNEAGAGTSRMCIETSLEICRKRGISPEILDAIILATSTPDMITPSTSNIVAHAIGASKAWAIDINGACSGFISALDIASRYVEQGIYKYVLVLGADKMSAIIDENDRITAALFGDGSGGVLLEPGPLESGIQDCFLRTDGSGRDFLFVKAGGSAWPATSDTVDNREHFMYMDGKAIFEYAVLQLTESINGIMQRNNLTADDVIWLVPHQANRRIIIRTAEVLQFPVEKIMINVDRYGNTTAGTIPLCLWDYEPQLKKGDKLILAAFGSGFTWGAMYMIWDYDA
ncbi:3-oxoacyl-ACP synthase III family protein [Chitinophaga sp. Hz27]|uniref:3-oxoacyl-ACP synthase III family protein n=1 Tax=Chitinophaga sp. Hz27 TaxID=3347169 RepID=UPI0035DBC512